MAKELRNGEKMSLSRLREVLSQEDSDKTETVVERTADALCELQALLEKLPHVQNGKLLYGSTSYTAYRTETLSLIFETALATFQKTSASGRKSYDRFLSKLGEEVGLTFAREVVWKLRKNNCLQVLGNLRLVLDLWSSYENDTGAGITIIKQCSEDKVIILLKNNPLRARERVSHAHCGFYRYYIESFLNEVYTLGARSITGQIGDMIARKVVSVEEDTDVDDNCIFTAEVRFERLRAAFNHLVFTYEQFEKLAEEDDFSPLMNEARNALIRAQREAIGWQDKTASKHLYKVFQFKLAKDDFKRMHDLYPRLASHAHAGEKDHAKLSRRLAWDLLVELRHVIYTLESLDLEESSRSALREKVKEIDKLEIVGRFVQKAEETDLIQRRTVERLIKRLEKEFPAKESDQGDLISHLKKIGGGVWDFCKPILIEIVSVAIKKRFNLSG